MHTCLKLLVKKSAYFKRVVCQALYLDTKHNPWRLGTLHTLEHSCTPGQRNENLEYQQSLWTTGKLLELCHVNLIIFSHPTVRDEMTTWRDLTFHNCYFTEYPIAFCEYFLSTSPSACIKYILQLNLVLTRNSDNSYCINIEYSRAYVRVLLGFKFLTKTFKDKEQSDYLQSTYPIISKVYMWYDTKWSKAAAYFKQIWNLANIKNGNNLSPAAFVLWPGSMLLLCTSCAATSLGLHELGQNDTLHVIFSISLESYIIPQGTLPFKIL